MKKQVIVNIDPFNIQDNVVEYAIFIARKMDLPLMLYCVQTHVVMRVAAETGGQVVGMGTKPVDWTQSVKDKAERYFEKVKKSYTNTRFEHELGQLADSVNSKLNHLYEKAYRHSPYLLVMPKSQEYNWWTDLAGTAETTIASEAPCPEKKKGTREAIFISCSSHPLPW